MTAIGAIKQDRVQTLSYGFASDQRRANVGTFLHPRSRLSNATPLWEELWTPLFMALKAPNRYDDVYKVNIYAPIERARE